MVYFDGMKAGAVPGVNDIAGGEIVSVKVAWVRVGMIVGVLAGWSVEVLSVVCVAVRVGISVAITALGPKGVKVGDGSWLGVTVGPLTTSWRDGPIPEHAAIRIRANIRNNKGARCDILKPFSIKALV
jgi:hypothetical protein